MGRSFGARMEATVVYYRQEQHIRYQRTQRALRDLHGVSLSQGGIDQIMQRAGKKAVAELEGIQKQIRQSAVILSNETSSRVDGSNGWHWVFCSLTAVLHGIRFNRSVDVIQDVMGQSQAEVWVSDCLAAQLKAPAQERQICLSHQLRNLQAVVDRYPTAFWAQAMQALFRYAIHLRNQRDQLPPDHFQTQVARIERLCDWLIGRPLLQPEGLNFIALKLHLLAFFDIPFDGFCADVSSRTNVIPLRPQCRVLPPILAAEAFKFLFQLAGSNAFEQTDNFGGSKLRRCAYNQMHMVGHNLNCQNFKTGLCGNFRQQLFQPRLDGANQNLFSIARYPNQMVVDFIRTVWPMVGSLWHRPILAKERGFLHPLKRSGFRREEL